MSDYSLPYCKHDVHARFCEACRKEEGIMTPTPNCGRLSTMHHREHLAEILFMVLRKQVETYVSLHKSDIELRKEIISTRNIVRNRMKRADRYVAESVGISKS